MNIAETFLSILIGLPILTNMSVFLLGPFLSIDSWGIRPHLWHKKWNTLSGGEMQRISIAIGCSFRPEILLLDGK